MAIIKKTDDNKFRQGLGAIITLIHCWWECKMVQPFGKQFSHSLNCLTLSYHVVVIELLSCICLLCNPMDCSPPGSFCPQAFPGKNTGVGCPFLLQEILLTQRSNPHLLLGRQILHYMTCQFHPLSLYSREIKRDIPGGPVVKNQPANTRGRDLICGPGTFHARPLKPGSLALQQEPWQQKSVHCKQREVTACTTRENPHTATKTQHSHKNKLIKKEK